MVKLNKILYTLWLYKYISIESALRFSSFVWGEAGICPDSNWTEKGGAGGYKADPKQEAPTHQGPVVQSPISANPGLTP